MENAGGDLADKFETLCRGRAGVSGSKSAAVAARKYPCPPGSGPWTVKECAGALSMAPQSIREAIEAGHLRAYRLKCRGSGERTTYRIQSIDWLDYVAAAATSL